VRIDRHISKLDSPLVPWRAVYTLGMSNFAEQAAAKFAELGIDLNDSSNAISGISGTAEDWEGEEEDDVDDLGSENIVQTLYQLGFLEEGVNALHDDPNWRNWDGGRIGGKPAWLNPAAAPPPSALLCTSCNEPLQFVLQIYCPLDEVVSAFHRDLYVFSCRHARCIATNPDSVRVIRSQLPRENPYYAYSPQEDNKGGHDTAVNSSTTASVVTERAYTKAALCELCGCGGPFSCKACSAATYCSRSHQRRHWKSHKAVCTSNAKPAVVSSLGDGDSAEAGPSAGAAEDVPGDSSHCLYAAYDLVVSPEELVKDNAASKESSATIWEDAHTKGGADEAEDLQLQQSDYDKALGNKSHDPQYVAFLSRIRRGGQDQVLRYARWETGTGPLPISFAAAELSDEKKHPVPSCVHCHAPRRFEFQVMPQLLHFLKVDMDTHVTNPDAQDARYKVGMGQAPDVPLAEAIRNSKDSDVDWGTLDVYTCTASCDASTATANGYATEYVRIVAGQKLN